VRFRPDETAAALVREQPEGDDFVEKIIVDFALMI